MPQALVWPKDLIKCLGEFREPERSQKMLGDMLHVIPSLIHEPGFIGRTDTRADDTRPPKHDVPPPATKGRIHRYRPTGQPAECELYNQIWLNPSLANRQLEAWSGRREGHGGDGSDRDPAWVVLEL